MPKLYNEPLTQAHINELLPKIQGPQHEFASMFQANPNFVRDISSVGPMVAFSNEQGVIGAAGLIDFPGTGRAMLWTVFAANIVRDFAALYKQGVCILQEIHPRRRVEITIDPEFAEAKRLAKIAGFKYEGTMEAYDSTGKDYELWAKINRGAS